MDKRSNKASTSKSVDLAGFAPAASMEALLSSAGGTSAQDGIEIDGGDSTMDVKEPASHATSASSATASAKKDQPKRRKLNERLLTSPHYPSLIPPTTLLKKMNLLPKPLKRPSPTSHHYQT
eukprot:g11481.t1 g11481   contig5:968380-968745(+)